MSAPFDTSTSITIPPRARVSDWTLERMALAELDADELRAAHGRLALETGGLDRLAALERDNVAILKQYPPEQMVPAIERKLRRAARDHDRAAFRRGWWTGLLVGGGLAAAAALITAAVVFGDRLAQAPSADPQVPAFEETRLKGLEPHVVVHRQADGEAERLSSGALAQPGDVVQVGYVAGGHAYGVVLSIDGAGVVTLHHPEFATLPAVIGGEGRTDLPFAYTLDEAPGFERFVFVSSRDRLDVDGVLDAARRVASGGEPAADLLLLPDGTAQHSLVLWKDQR